VTLRGGGSPRDPRFQARRVSEDGESDQHVSGPLGGARSGASDLGRAERGSAANRARTRYGYSGQQGIGVGGAVRFLAFAVILAVLVLGALLTVLRPLARAGVIGWAYDNPAALRVPFVADLVREDLGTLLTQPAGTDASAVEFDVNSGDTVQTLAPRLAAAHLIRDQRAFVFEAIEQGLPSKLLAGAYLLQRTMTPSQVVSGLVEGRMIVRTTTVTFREGLRLEQMTAKLQTIQTGVDPREFYDLVEHPPASFLADFAWLDLPQGRSLEGYLYPATYTLVVQAPSSLEKPTSAEDLVRQMLKKFHDVAGDLMTVPKARGMTFYQVLKLASLVEREVQVDSERPLIAGVYQNRLNGFHGVPKLLEADPTIFYVNDTLQLESMPFDQWQTYVFWAKLKDQLPATLPPALAGYNTYTHSGLMPGPICSPTVASITASLTPDTATGYLWFIAKGDGSGTSAFAKTIAEYQANLKKYAK
jgi:UPF0755 protein